MIDAISAQPPQAELRPPVEGFSGWWDASDIGSMQTTPNGRVSQWRDKSGNARHLAQGGGPNYQGWTGSVTVNGRNVYFQQPGITALMQGPAPVSTGVFSVCFVASAWNVVGVRNPWVMGTSSGEGTVYLDADGTIATRQNTGFDTGRAWELRRTRVVVGRFNGNTGHQVDVDGRYPHSGGGGPGLPGASWDLGAREVSETWIGWIGEVVVYTRLLTASETERMSAYLLRKWGLA